MPNEQTRLNPVTRQRAAALRRNATSPEKLLWSMLRAKNLAGLKFRRQHAIEPYIVDFYCAAERLIIELDGESHEGREAYDAKRQAMIESKGYSVLRFTNDEVMDNLDGVLESVLQATSFSGSSTLP